MSGFKRLKKEEESKLFHRLCLKMMTSVIPNYDVHVLYRPNIYARAYVTDKTAFILFSCTNVGKLKKDRFYLDLNDQLRETAMEAKGWVKDTIESRETVYFAGYDWGGCYAEALWSVLADIQKPIPLIDKTPPNMSLVTFNAPAIGGRYHRAKVRYLLGLGSLQGRKLAFARYYKGFDFTRMPFGYKHAVDGIKLKGRDKTLKGYLENLK